MHLPTPGICRYSAGSPVVCCRIAVRMASPSQPKSLIFDLEVAPGKADQPDDRIFMVGALRPDTGAELERKVDKDLPSVLDALDSLG